MLLEDTTIYPLIKNYPELCQLHHFNRNKYITCASWGIEDIWYLVSGKVKVETTSANGKRILVDTITEDNYVGHLSNYWKQNLYCDSLTVVASTLICIPKATFDDLMESPVFSRHFFMKTNARLYDMYKKDLMRKMFTQRQQFAFYLIENAKDNVCHFSGIRGICESLDISRRNLYNLLDTFTKEGLLSYPEDNLILLENKVVLEEIARPVSHFIHNTQ